MTIRAYRDDRGQITVIDDALPSAAWKARRTIIDLDEFAGDADSIAESATKKWAGETGADVTASHEAATVAALTGLDGDNLAESATRKWAGVTGATRTRTHVGTYTRSTAGNLTITDPGWQPRIVLFFATGGSGGTYQVASIGCADASNDVALVFYGNTVGVGLQTSRCIVAQTDASNLIRAYVSSITSTGYVLTFDLTGTASVDWIAISIE